MQRHSRSPTLSEYEYAVENEQIVPQDPNAAKESATQQGAYEVALGVGVVISSLFGLFSLLLPLKYNYGITMSWFSEEEFRSTGITLATMFSICIVCGIMPKAPNKRYLWVSTCVISVLTGLYATFHAGTVLLETINSIATAGGGILLLGTAGAVLTVISVMILLYLFTHRRLKA